MLDEINIKVDEKKWAAHPRVKVGGREHLPEAEKMTPEMIERRRSRMNKPFIPSRVNFNYAATRDTITHFVDGIGDTNPLFKDAEYARKSRYGRCIAPGSFLYTHQWTTMAGGFSGVHAWYSGGDWEWYRPVYEDTRLGSVIIVRDLAVKKSRMTGGSNIYIDYGDVVYLNADSGEILGKELYHNVWAERAAAGGAKKEFGKARPAYSRSDWLKMLEMYDTEEVRGNKPRNWEDVRVGDRVGPMIKGPLSVRDEIAWLMGAGTLFMRAHKNEFEYELRHPKALEYVESLGMADVPELVHFIDEFAQTIGIERAYDYGSQRMSWLCNLFTNWMGDDGFLWKMSGDLRTFNQMDDLTIFEGKVTGKRIEEGKCCVDIEAWAKNQRGEISMPPHIAVVVLPSKEHGPPAYPTPSPSLVAEVKRAQPLEKMIKEGLI